jgi:hypothetical protein
MNRCREALSREPEVHQLGTRQFEEEALNVLRNNRP